MHPPLLLSLLPLQGLVACAPAVAPGAAFSVPLIRNDGFEARTGLDAMLRAYAKYNASLTPQLQVAVRINSKFRTGLQRRAGSVWATVQAVPPAGYDYEYISPVKIGTPPQTVKVVIDTGSADFWVMSTDTPSTQVAGQAIYRPRLSSTSRRVAGATWSISYGDGSGASGVVYTDRVAVGGASFAAQAVESATSVSRSFTDDAQLSGLMGLGMSRGSTVRPGGALTFMDNVKGALRAPVFTANLKRGRAGNYNFGYVARVEYSGALQYARADASSVYWTIRVGGYRVGGGTGKFRVAPWTAVVDTGTTLLLLPDAVVDAYYARLPGAAFDPYWAAVVFPCGAAPPDFVFGIANYRGLVPGRYVNYGPVNRTHCYGGIQSSAGIGFSIFGDVLLKAQFVVFDLGRKMVGFANKKLEP